MDSRAATLAPSPAPSSAPRAPSRAAPGWFDSSNPSRHIPALDGLRALAVTAVVLYHFGLPWAGAGYIGVDVFFVLSGYLITSLLVGHHRSAGNVGLQTFWARRARRLLPALFLMLAGTSVWAYLDRAHVALATFRSDALATLLYVANWHQILAHQSYFSQFAAPSPLSHTWSLAIEEQFYLAWPLLVAGCLALRARPSLRRRSARTRHPRLPLLVMATLLAAASVADMASAYHGQSDTSAVYYSTLTRAFELLGGGVLAIVLVDRPSVGRVRRAGLDLAATIAIAGLVVVWLDASGPPGWMYRGGFVATVVCAAVVIAACATREPGVIGRVLSVAPLRYLGRISYGVYLWHWPIIVFLTPATTGLGGAPLDLLRAALTLAISVTSYHLVEVPLRRASFAGWRRRAAAPLAAVATAGVILVATVATPVAVAGASSARSTERAPRGDLPATVAGGPYPVSPRPPVPSPSTPSPADPVRVMVIGDSVMWTAEPALASALQSTGDATVTSEAFVGWGLTTAKNWRQEFPELIGEDHPQVVMGTWSWDNTMAMDHPAQYRSLLNSFVSLLLAPGDGVHSVVLFQFPPLGPLWSIDPDAAKEDPARFAGVRAWDAAAAAVARDHPGTVVYAQVAPSVEVRGKFSPWLPNGTGGWTRARMVDNTHFCPWGASVYAAGIAITLDPIYHLPPPTGSWWSGTWTSDSRYAQANGFPGGACPDDQPPPHST